MSERRLDDVVARRRDAAIAGHRGDADLARSLLDDEDPDVRATALGALNRLGLLKSLHTAMNRVADLSRLA